jgi:hypothetical protein
MPAKPVITQLRLIQAGLVQGNMNRTIRPDDNTELRWHAQGVEVQRDNIITLIPWGAIGSVQSTVPPKRQKTKQPATTSESNVAHARTSAGAGRADSSARSAPSR